MSNKYLIPIALSAALIPSANLFAKQPTTVVYHSLKSANIVFLVVSQGDLTKRKLIEDRIAKRLSEYRTIKSYIIFPPHRETLSKEIVQNIANKLVSEGVNTFLIVDSVPLQGSIECRSSSNFSIYNMPESGVSTSTTCNHVDDWIYRITIQGVNDDSAAAVSELRASDQGIFDELATDLGASISNQMIDRMLKSLIKSGAF